MSRNPHQVTVDPGGGSAPRRAVTLFELIVVVVVAALLAVLMFLSTQFLIVRTKVSRVKEEHRVLVRALQNYQMDYANLPGEQMGLEALTAPTAYLASVPNDPFAGDPGTPRYLYFSPDGRGHVYALISAGPDRKLDISPVLSRARGYSTPSDGQPVSESSASHNASPPGAAAATDWFQDYLVHYSYDPTNGTASDGDIISLIVNY